MSEVIVVTSGKGGVGKTTVAANLGCGLALLGNKVVLIDTDIGLRNLDVVMGLENRIVYNLVDVVEGGCRIKQALIKDKNHQGLYLMPSAQTRDKSSVTPQQMKKLTQELTEEFDYVILDCPAGIEQGFKNAVAGASRAIVVTTPEVSAIRDADRVMGLLEADGMEKIEMIINRIRPDLVARGDMMSLSDIQEILTVPIIGAVTDEEETVSASRIDADTLVFEMNYTDESGSGIYSLESLDFEADEQTYSLDFSKCGIEGKYGVNQSCETEPDAVVEDSDTQEETNDSDVSFTTITKDGEVTENTDISDVVEDAVAQQSSDFGIAVYAENGARTTSTGKVIVVLDPGHGGFDPGTSGFGANEKDLTLKIAKYCKAALESDGRIQIYMTRETDTSVGNATDVSTDLYNRIQYAIGKKADLFVSLHLNSAGASAKGSEVYYPNSNYRADIGAQGKTLATDIQNELVKLGLYNRGAKIQNSTSSKYSDNSVQDYYYVIQQSKRAGFPGIIVEHAFLSNQNDYNNYLSSDEKLKKRL